MPSPYEELKQDLILTVFGASGDLAHKAVVPAIYELWVAGHVPENIEVFGFTRSHLSEKELLDLLVRRLVHAEGTHDSVPASSHDRVPEFMKRMRYIIDHGEGEAPYEHWQKEIAKIEKTKFDGRSSNRITFLAIPPQAFSTVSPLVKKYGYSAKGANRVIIEKPWGHDSDSAVKLIERIRADWDEEEVYAVDHLLAADMVRNIIPIRFGNSWVEPLLNRDNVASITCSFAEHFGVEGRGSFFDITGIVRDVCQNHVLQGLCLLTMDAPASLAGEDIRDAKMKLVSAMPPVRPEDVIIGQFTDSLDGSKKGYTSEPGVKEDSRTETWTEFVCYIDNDRWRGVPILFRAGKAIEEWDVSYIVNFKPPKANLFPNAEPTSLFIKLGPTPAGLHLKTNLLQRQLIDFELQSVDLNWSVPDLGGAMFVEAYEKIWRWVVKGNHAGFVREDELLESWRIFTPMLRWIESAEAPKLHKYPYGSKGPEARIEFEKRFGILNYL